MPPKAPQPAARPGREILRVKARLYLPSPARKWGLGKMGGRAEGKPAAPPSANRSPAKAPQHARFRIALTSDPAKAKPGTQGVSGPRGL